MLLLIFLPSIFPSPHCCPSQAPHLGDPWWGGHSRRPAALTKLRGGLREPMDPSAELPLKILLGKYSNITTGGEGEFVNTLLFSNLCPEGIPRAKEFDELKKNRGAWKYRCSATCSKNTEFHSFSFAVAGTRRLKMKMGYGFFYLFIQHLFFKCSSPFKNHQHAFLLN